MLNHSLIILPMDDRPCTYDFPRQLGEISGAKVFMPPKEAMGNLEKIADRRSLGKWLLSKANEAEGLLLSVDTLAYGGLIPSRRLTDTFEEVARELLVIKELKRINPNLMIYACSSIMRISNSNENQEEKTYWSEYGEMIHRYSCLLDKYYVLKEDDYDQLNDAAIMKPDTHEAEILELRKKIPDEILKDYIAGRFRNFKINKLMIKWAKEGLLDYFIICADDSSQYGFNVLEKRILNRILDKIPALKNKIIIYPGTDESVSLLLARFINRKENFVPKFYPKYSKSSKGGFMVTMYEGIALKETLICQIKAAGGVVAPSPETADVVLYLHTSDETQEDQYLNAIYRKPSHPVPDELIESDVTALKREMQNKPVALIDVAYANGGDHQFMNKLSQETDLKKLISYAAWNTAGNSIGTALAHSVVRLLTRNKNNKKSDELHYSFLFDRFLDDWLYEGFERLKFVQSTTYPVPPEELEKLKTVVENVGKKFLHLHDGSNLHPSGTLDTIELTGVSFPWKRIFEVDVKCKVTIK